MNKRYPSKQQNPSPLSNDPNAVKLANLTRPDVVIGIKALQAIVANFSSNLNEEWLIPMKVTKINGDKLVLFLDSPLIKPMAKTPLEKYQLFLRKAAKQLLIKPWNEVLDDETEIGKSTLLFKIQMIFETRPLGGLLHNNKIEKLISVNDRELLLLKSLKIIFSDLITIFYNFKLIHVNADSLA